MNILDELAAYAAVRVAKAKTIKSLNQVRQEAEQLPQGNFPFARALQKEGLAFICECKKASPSKGLIAENFPYLQIAKDYEQAGADCISVLTEPKWFLGSNKYLAEIASKVKIPCLRKDFTVDPYMIYEAKLLGASAVLLICGISTDTQIKEYLKICDSVGLSALVEAHDATEIKRAVEDGAKIIGVNNRNLKNFSVDVNNSAKLRALVPKNILYISESGIKTPEDVRAVKNMGADGVLIGEALMRSKNITAALQRLKGGADD
ncbi:MAG: indole-3-glycerol phosphate synthase TrpC [Acidaminococcaceae bacterium]|jgi:indole-3-glycerol phosphate synthase|nr:indole-3-glycerol phosphate synthase TrpC [Acidaminococcaceae bacterium]